MYYQDIIFLTNWLGNTPCSIAAIIAIGFVSGILSSFLGIGGGFIFTPFFHAILRLPAIEAVATSMAHIPLTMSSATIRYARFIDYKYSILILAGALPSVHATAYYWNLFNESRISQIIIFHYTNLADIITAGLFTLLLTIQLLLPADKLFKNENKSIKIRNKPLILVCTGIIMGIFSALLGIGGGFIIVPVLVYVLDTESLHATATSVFSILITSIIASVQYIHLNQVHLLLSLLAGTGGVAGAQLGSRLAIRVPKEKHKIYLRVFHLTILVFYLTLRILF